MSFLQVNNSKRVDKLPSIFKVWPYINTTSLVLFVLQWTAVFEAADHQSHGRDQADEYYGYADHHGHLDVHL